MSVCTACSYQFWSRRSSSFVVFPVGKQPHGGTLAVHSAHSDITRLVTWSHLLAVPLSAKWSRGTGQMACVHWVSNFSFQEVFYISVRLSGERHPCMFQSILWCILLEDAFSAQPALDFSPLDLDRTFIRADGPALSLLGLDVDLHWTLMWTFIRAGPSMRSTEAFTWWQGALTSFHQLLLLLFLLPKLEEEAGTRVVN